MQTKAIPYEQVSITTTTTATNIISIYHYGVDIVLSHNTVIIHVTISTLMTCKVVFSAIANGRNRRFTCLGID